MDKAARNFARPAILAIAAAFSTASAAAGPVPPALSAAAAKARLSGPFSAWCAGALRPGRPGAFAVAAQPAQGAARYLVVERDGRSFELSAFKGRADLSCYTPAEARRLSASIAVSQTIKGKVNPRWPSTVICGFVEETNAICWQYSSAQKRFVKVGEWVT
jgi:hypothetical protein